MTAKTEISAYPPAYLKLLVAASTSSLSLTMTFRQANYYRHQLYQLRGLLRKQRPTAYQQIKSVVIKIIPASADLDTKVEMRLLSEDSNVFSRLIEESLPEVMAVSIAKAKERPEEQLETSTFDIEEEVNLPKEEPDPLMTLAGLVVDPDEGNKI